MNASQSSDFTKASTPHIKLKGDVNETQRRRKGNVVPSVADLSSGTSQGSLRLGDTLPAHQSPKQPMVEKSTDLKAVVVYAHE